MRAKQRTVSIVITVEGDWVTMLPFTLNTLARQLYPLNRIETILVTTKEYQPAVAAVAAQFKNLTIRIVTDPMTGVFTPSYRKRLGWQMATGDYFIGVDADVLIPSYTLALVDTVLTAHPGFILFGDERKDITLDDSIYVNISELFVSSGIDEFMSAGLSGRAQLAGLYAKHPWFCASFIFAIERSNLLVEDFVTEYDGLWGVEDNDLTISLYKRGICPLSHPDLKVLHWQHTKQDDGLYDAQLALAFRRHPEPYIINRDSALLYSRQRLPSWQAPRPKTYPYVVHFRSQQYKTVVSFAIVLQSLYLAMRTRAYAEGRPLPTITDFSKINHLLPHEDNRTVKNIPDLVDPKAQIVNIWCLVYGGIYSVPSNETYNIGYLALEGEVIDQGYLSYLQLYDALWVSSARNAATLRAQGWNKPLAIIPLGVFSGYFFPHRFRPDDTVKWQFLTVGTGQRKQNFALIDTFATTFNPDEQVKLVVWDNFQAKYCRQYIQRYWPKWQSLIVVPDIDRTNVSISQLFVTSDAFVTASRGEAWQLPVLEAMACGMPILAPRDNGIPYLNETNAILYNSHLITGVAPFGYVEPDLDDLGRLMRALVVDPQPARERSSQLLDVIHTHYSWFSSARIAWQWLDDNVPHD